MFKTLLKFLFLLLCTIELSASGAASPTQEDATATGPAEGCLSCIRRLIGNTQGNTESSGRTANAGMPPHTGGTGVDRSEVTADPRTAASYVVESFAARRTATEIDISWAPLKKNKKVRRS